jgi:hypothetical protein
MSETRALRDKLEELQAELRRSKEHLEKLRAHQSRERESLGQELEVARREVVGLRTRLAQLEPRQREPQAQVAAPLPQAAPVVVGRAGAAPTALVALVHKPERLDEALPKLARLLKLSPADMRLRLSALAPVVVARLPVSEARALCEVLRSEGFLAVSAEVPARELRRWMRVRTFSLKEHGMSLEDPQGERQELLYMQLRLLIRGRRNFTVAETREVIPFYERREGDRPTESVKLKQERAEQYLWAYGDDFRVAFTQETRFTGLEGARGLAAFESFQALLVQLERRAPNTVVDTRFMQQPRFTLPLVEEDQGQEMLGELLYQAIREGLWS